MGHLAICMSGSDEMIGSVSFRKRDVWEVSYSLMPEYWGRRVGSEAVGLGVRWFFDQLPGERFTASVHVDNVPSRAILDKLGLELDRSEHRGKPVVLYELVQA